jgi:hypothetical protein
VRSIRIPRSIALRRQSGAVAAAWAAIPEERRAIILAGEAAIVDRRKPLDDWVAIGKAFHELQHEAMQQSNSKQPKGRRYSDAYALLQLPREIANLQKIDKSDRKKTIWLYENEEPVRRWYETLASTSAPTSSSTPQSTPLLNLFRDVDA